MVSRRNFMSITMMMFALFFLFQVMQVLKEIENDYDTNSYYGQTGLTAKNEWKYALDREEMDVVFVGQKGSPLETTAEEWCRYTKRTMKTVSTLEEVFKKEVLPEVILLDGKNLEKNLNWEAVSKKIANGGTLVFCNLPSAEELEQNDALRTVLGVTQVLEKKVDLNEIHLFSGFLLGGEVILEREQNQGISFESPWFLIDHNTKTYWMGSIETIGEKITNEQQPPLIWRNSIQDGRIFAVNGEFLQGEMGLGILTGMMAEAKEFELYPVVNAQVVTVSDFSGFSKENEERLQEIYNRNQADLTKNIILPGLAAVMEKRYITPSYLFSLQQDYEDEREAQQTEVVYYMQQIKEQRGEIGWSVDAKQGTDLQSKLRWDAEFYDACNLKYKIASVFIKENDLGQLSVNLSQPLLNNVQTVCVRGKENSFLPVLSYYQEDKTLQKVTGQAHEVTYEDQLKMISLQSALGYQNMEVDLKQVIWPTEERNQWEVFGKETASNLTSYWNPWGYFDAMSLSGADRRIRQFLALDYSFEREKDTITLDVTGMDREGFFILRTHEETVEKITGGEVTELEENAFLIHAQNRQVKLQLAKVERPQQEEAVEQ